MKRIVAIMIAAGAMSLGGCKEKKQSDDIITTKPEQETRKPSAPVRMQEYRNSVEVDWVGRKYTVEISRTPADSLPNVKDDGGQLFVDNVIAVRIVRSNGSVFFSKKFTKLSFEGYLPEGYVKKGILEGMVFDKVDGSKLEFAASVCYPQTDEYVPLEVGIDNFGNISIERDEELDTHSETSLLNEE